MIDSSTLATTIQSQISSTVDEHIREYVGNIIRELSLDAAWINKIEQQINDNISRKFSQKLTIVDINSLIAQSMDDAITRYYDRQPKKQTGISDQAQQPELIVSDQTVTIHNELKTSRLTVDRDAVVSGSLTVQNIAIRGAINTDNKSWQQLVSDLSNNTLAKLNEEWRHQLVAEVKKEITDAGINFHEVNIAGASLIKDGHLNDSITTSNLRSVGALDQLCVRGAVDMCDSLSIRNKRIGINTQHPDMALSVWDEEVALAFGKHKQQTAYLGTLKPQAMVIGINRQPAIDINEQGRVTVNHLTVGRHRVCHEPEIPNYSGTKGDIVFNSNPRGDGVWAWQCLGAFKWTPLRSA